MIPICFSQLRHGGKYPFGSGIVEGIIEPTVKRDRFLNQGFNVCGLRDICFDKAGFSAQLPDLLDSLIACGFSPRRYHDFCPLFGKLQGSGSTHARTSPSDEGSFIALQIHHVFSLQIVETARSFGLTQC
jgi:hypothetical protein